jgi:arylsulfatase A-like enzyme
VRNVLLLTIDCLGADKLWRSGGTRLSTLAALEREGVSYRNTFSTTSSTTPSIASVMTGTYPGRHGILSTRGWSLNPEVSTLAEHARVEGCTTLAYASGPLTRSSGLDRGFQRYQYVEPLRILRFIRWGVAFSRQRANTSALLRTLESVASRSEPWFHWVHLLDLHNRWRRKPLFRRSRVGYEEALDTLDEKLATIMSYVDLDSTLVVVTADHGHFVRELDADRLPEADYEEAHGFNVCDLLTRVPLIIVARGLLPADRVVKAIAQNVDISRTIRGLMGWTGASEAPGRSLERIVEEPDPDENRAIYLQACGSILGRPENYLHAVRVEHWKLVDRLAADDGRDVALFDLRADPDERQNVRDRYPEVVSRLGALLQGFRDDRI